MKQLTRYSATIKESFLAKALATNAPSILQLAKEFNIPYQTLYNWVVMSKKQNIKYMRPPERPQDKSPEAKLQAVIDTCGKTEAEVGAYCRENGIHTHHLDEWKKQSLAGLSPTPTVNKKDKAEQQQAAKEITQLKRDLLRKDKALAEVSALLILKKKADLLWGIDEDV